MLGLRQATPGAWAEAVMADFGAFLQDHAAAERKASQSALVLAAQHPRHVELVEAMMEVTEEELLHFRQVWGLLRARGLTLSYDAPDPYISRFFKALRKNDQELYLLDRLIGFGVVEARGCERFKLVAEALPDGELKTFYADLVGSESRHHALFLRLARGLFPGPVVDERLDALLDVEAEVVRGLSIRAALH